MSKVSVSMQLGVSAERAWAMVGGFHGLLDWSSGLKSCTAEQGGRVRRLLAADGMEILERLEAFSESERFYSYSIIESPLPVTNYQSTLKVIPVFGQEQCHVEWSCNFYAPAEHEAQMEAAFQGLYQGGLDQLKQKLAE
ncbi:SRPBCC family protein [Rugamonas sp.]|uniref:SRPBCC family protein n=1 Tax=Rugamonas sp. TaxID=1926287 RepID=UPI0025FC8EF9|nr:SRPBCC family protein [Rugamonas sp.]